MTPDTTGTLFLPPQSSTLAGEVDALFNFVLYVSIVFFLIIVLGSAYFALRYRKRRTEQLDTAPSHSAALELAWTIIPVILVFTTFFWGFKVYLKMHIVPKDAIEVKVTAQKWFWSFDYTKENVNSVNELVVPVNKPVQLTMSSTDVIHSFYVPGFRIKMDVLPNRYTVTWFEASNPGSYDLFCSEYCGSGHSEMIGKVRAVSDRDYKEWLDSVGLGGEEIPLIELGAKAYSAKACNTCHSIDGRPGIGPSFKGHFGSQQKMADGTTVTVDENYVRESILNPNAKVVQGYQSVMPSYQGLLKGREIDALIEYIKSLQE
ncbi:cytochrome c oxidase subunit II [candidate division KSB1 bacterium]|nr:cytochrome c oxidase subunit II [candidate division KSB1 bacterium]RQW00476.1 MAG: cytochrome c oxidase subunit II [candidate division KSB1 bacterium]